MNDNEIVAPDGRTHLHRKFHIHCACITFGLAVAIVLSYVPATDKIFFHFVPGMPLIPSLVQEVLDRILAL